MWEYMLRIPRDDIQETSMLSDNVRKRSLFSLAPDAAFIIEWFDF